MDDRSYIRLAYEKGTPLSKIAETLGISVQAVKSRASRDAQCPKHASLNRIQVEADRLGLDINTVDHGWIKTEDASLHFRNDLPQKELQDLISNLVDEVKAHAPKYPKITRDSKSKHGSLLLVDIADIHFGKLSIQDQIGADYNLEIAKKRFYEGLCGLIELASGFDIKQIIFVLGNDVLHVDNPHRTTTKGTPQDTDGMWQEAFQTAKMCYIYAVEHLVQIADVHLVYNPSNHDLASGYMLADTVASWFHNNPNVTTQVSYQERQYIKFGYNLIGLTHGDGAKLNDMAGLMAQEASQAWAQTKYRYWVQHHVHHKHRLAIEPKTKKIFDKEKDRIGYSEIKTGLKLEPSDVIHVEYMRTPSPPDSWHSKHGYANVQAVEAFVFHPILGQTARLSHFF